MRYHMIEIHTKVDGSVNIYDMTSLIYQKPIRGKLWRGNHLEEIVGNNHTVYVLDSYDEFSRSEMIGFAHKWLSGDYEVYSLVTGEISRGKNLLIG